MRNRQKWISFFNFSSLLRSNISLYNPTAWLKMVFLISIGAFQMVLKALKYLKNMTPVMRLASVCAYDGKSNKCNQEYRLLVMLLVRENHLICTPHGSWWDLRVFHFVMQWSYFVDNDLWYVSSVSFPFQLHWKLLPWGFLTKDEGPAAVALDGRIRLWVWG